MLRTDLSIDFEELELEAELAELQLKLHRVHRKSDEQAMMQGDLGGRRTNEKAMQGDLGGQSVVMTTRMQQRLEEHVQQHVSELVKEKLEARLEPRAQGELEGPHVTWRPAELEEHRYRKGSPTNTNMKQIQGPSLAPYKQRTHSCNTENTTVSQSISSWISGALDPLQSDNSNKKCDSAGMRSRTRIKNRNTRGPPLSGNQIRSYTLADNATHTNTKLNTAIYTDQMPNHEFGGSGDAKGLAIQNPDRAGVNMTQGHSNAPVVEPDHRVFAVEEARWQHRNYNEPRQLGPPVSLSGLEQEMKRINNDQQQFETSSKVVVNTSESDSKINRNVVAGSSNASPRAPRAQDQYEYEREQYAMLAAYTRQHASANDIAAHDASKNKRNSSKQHFKNKKGKSSLKRGRGGKYSPVSSVPKHVAESNGTESTKLDQHSKICCCAHCVYSRNSNVVVGVILFLVSGAALAAILLFLYRKYVK